MKPKENILPFPPQQLVEIPASLNTPEFLEAWAEFIEYKAVDLKQPMTERAMRMCLKRIAPWGAQRATAAIIYTIGNGSRWQGIYEEVHRDGAGHTPQSPARFRSLREINEIIHAKREMIDKIKHDRSNWRKVVKYVTELLNGDKHTEYDDALKEEARLEIQRLNSEISQLVKERANLK